MRRLWTREEDKILRQYAGIKTAAEIAAIVNRPKNGVHHRMNKLNLDGRLTGDKHHAFVGDTTQRLMVLCLHDAGYMPSEISIAFNLDLPRVQRFCNDPSYWQGEHNATTR